MESPSQGCSTASPAASPFPPSAQRWHFAGAPGSISYSKAATFTRQEVS